MFSDVAISTLLPQSASIANFYPKTVATKTGLPFGLFGLGNPVQKFISSV